MPVTAKKEKELGRPNEIAYQKEAANWVNLIGFVDLLSVLVQNLSFVQQTALTDDQLQATKASEKSPVRLYIWKMHPDGPFRCLIQVLHLGVVRFFISSMHPDESSECNYVRLLFIF